MSLLNDYRVHTSKVEDKVGEAMAKLHNGRQLLAQLLREDSTIRGAMHTDLTILARLLNESNEALRTVRS